MILTIAVPLVLVIGLIIGAEYLEHLADSTIPGGVTQLTATETNLTTAVNASVSYAANHQHSLAGVTTPSGLSAVVPSLTFLSISGSSTEIAVNMPTPGALVMTSYQTRPPACLGVLEIVSPQAIPVFVGFSATADPGTYYFEAPSAGGLCNAITMEPQAGGNYVSITGFPTAPLP